MSKIVLPSFAPTKRYDLDSKGQYNYSLTFSGNYVWTSYIFDTLDGDGSSRVKGTPTTSIKSCKVKSYLSSGTKVTVKGFVDTY